MLSHSPAELLLLASVLALAAFALHGRQGINLADEGFLWYGAQRTAAGEVPLRDFQSYDPGRYYWSALGVFFFGKGLVALRFSETLFQIIGLWAGLLIASRVAHDGWLLTAVGVALLLWMYPSYKLFDHTLLLGGIWVALRLLETPSPAQFLNAGIFLGLCVFFGRNHALYNLLAQALLLLFLHGRMRPLTFPEIEMWLAGIVLGLIPMIALFLCASGFASRYLQSIRAIFRNGTNLALPVPWPWRVSPFANALASRQFLLGAFFVVLPLGYISAIVFSLSMRSAAIPHHAVYTASAFVGLFYLHHAFSRADFSHLAQVIHPFIFIALALPGTLTENKFYLWSVLAVFITIAIVAVGRQTSRYHRLTSTTPWVPFAAGNRIFVPTGTNRLLLGLRQFVADNIQSREGVLAVPFTPAFYPILDRKSPLWDLAFYFPATADRQEEMIHDLAARKVNWVVISDTRPDKRGDLRFSATHPLVWKHLSEEFEPIVATCLPNSVKILRRRLDLVFDPIL